MPFASLDAFRLTSARHPGCFRPCRHRRSRPGLLFIGALTAAVSLVANPAAAQQTARASADTVRLTLAEVRRLALTRNPASLAEREEIAIANAGLRRARTIPFNPEASFQSVGGTTEIVATQELELLGQRGLRIDAARIGVSRATAAVSNAQRVAVFEASVAFLRTIAADRRLGVTRDGLALVDRLISAVRIQLREGEISTLDANLAEIEAGRARARVLAAQRTASNARLELKRLSGLSPDAPVMVEQDSIAAGPILTGLLRGEPGDTTEVSADERIAAAMERRPDLAASAAAVREFEALAALARRERLPNLRLGAVVESGNGGRSIGPALGMTVPLFNRNQGQITEREAQRRQAALRQQAVALRVRADVATAARAFQTASAEALVFEQSVRQPSRENAALLEVAFRAGKIPLATLLLLRNQLLEGELGYWDAWLARQEALVQLQAAIGAPTTTTTDSSAGTPR